MAVFMLAKFMLYNLFCCCMYLDLKTITKSFGQFDDDDIHI